MLKLVYICFLLCFLYKNGGEELRADSLILKLSACKTIHDFNQLHIGHMVKKQKEDKFLTSYGLRNLGSDSKTQYFPLKHKDWKGVNVTFKNNEVYQYKLLSHEADNSELKAMFSDLLALNGIEFNASSKKVFSKEAYSLSWPSASMQFNFTIVSEDQFQCTVVKVPKVFKESPKINDAQVNAKIAQFLGDGVHQLLSNN